FRPTVTGKVKRNESAEAGLDIGQKKIHPVEPAAALLGDRSAQPPACIPIAGKQSLQSREGRHPVMDRFLRGRKESHFEPRPNTRAGRCRQSASPRRATRARGSTTFV